MMMGQRISHYKKVVEKPGSGGMGVMPALVAGEVVGIVRMVSSVVVGDPMSSHPVILSFLSMDHYLFAFCLFCFSLVVLFGTGLVVSIRLKVANRFS